MSITVAYSATVNEAAGDEAANDKVSPRGWALQRILADCAREGSARRGARGRKGGKEPNTHGEAAWRRSESLKDAVVVRAPKVEVGASRSCGRAERLDPVVSMWMLPAARRLFEVWMRGKCKVLPGGGCARGEVREGTSRVGGREVQKFGQRGRKCCYKEGGTPSARAHRTQGTRRAMRSRDVPQKSLARGPGGVPIAGSWASRGGRAMLHGRQRRCGGAGRPRLEGGAGDDGEWATAARRGGGWVEGRLEGSSEQLQRVDKLSRSVRGVREGQSLVDTTRRGDRRSSVAAPRSRAPV